MSTRRTNPRRAGSESTNTTRSKCGLGRRGAAPGRCPPRTPAAAHRAAGAVPRSSARSRQKPSAGHCESPIACTQYCSVRCSHPAQMVICDPSLTMIFLFGRSYVHRILPGFAKVTARASDPSGCRACSRTSGGARRHAACLIVERLHLSGDGRRVSTGWLGLRRVTGCRETRRMPSA
jgi:hypothetical protein